MQMNRIGIIAIIGLLILESVAIALDFDSLGAGAGAATPSSGARSTFAIGARARSAQDLFIAYDVYLDYWASEWQTPEGITGWRLLAAGASVTRQFRLRHTRAAFYCGGGLGVNANFPTMKVLGKTQNKNLDFDLALHAVSGVTFPIDDHLSAFAELKYVLAGRMDYAGMWLGASYIIKP